MRVRLSATVYGFIYFWTVKAETILHLIMNFNEVIPFIQKLDYIFEHAEQLKEWQEDEYEINTKHIYKK